MPIKIASVHEAGVKLEVKGNILYISGNIISETPGVFMAPFLRSLHENIVKNGLKTITLNVTELTFLNSSGIRELVDWILLLEELPAEKQYSINIIYNSRHLWQESSVSTLVYLNPNLVTKEKI